MRVPTGLLVTILLAAVSILAQAPSQRDADVSGVRESHEGLTILAEPWTSSAQYKGQFPKKNPLDGGAIAINILFRNDTDKPLRVNLDRIRLLLAPPEGDRQQLAPLTSEELADLVLKPAAKDPSVPRSRLPIPVGKSSGGRGKKWDEFQAAAEMAGLGSEIVPPHGATRGLLYFDIARQFDLLEYARLYIPEIAIIGGNKNLFYFDLDLSKTGDH
jgi:hypothetical protein